MGSRRNNLVILGAVAVLVAVAAYFVSTQPTKLGLDLKGGVSVQLEGHQTGGGEVSTEEMQQAVEVIRQRVDSLGVTEPEIQLQGTNQVIVNIPGITDDRRAVDVIGKTAQLGFYEVLATGQPQVVSQGEIEEARNDIEEDLKDEDAFEEGNAKILFEETANPTGGGTIVTGYVVSQNPDLTGEAVDSATLARGDTGALEVQMTLTGDGSEGFDDLAQQIANNALAEGRPGQLAIVLDKDVVSAPAIDPNQTVFNGQVSITGGGPTGLPQAEAEELEVVLNTGALPVEMEILSVQQIGPTLGTDSLKSGLSAALVGFGLVLVFLFAVYRALGLVADLALLIYAFLLWGIVVAVPVTMTLPGIAGIVLSIGVAADANIVIFERIKEEVRRGKTPRSAIQVGYEKGFRAILDGNVTTVIVAIILFALSSGSVRGFAVLLTIGVVLSMFTAIAVTRALLGVVSGRGVRLTPGMMGVSKGEIRGQNSEAGRDA